MITKTPKGQPGMSRTKSLSSLRGDLSQTISSNLRHYSGSGTSISSACRAAGINRQQFAKYLSGDSIPSLLTLCKFGESMGVPPSAFFMKPPIEVNPNRANFAELCFSTSNGTTLSITPGYYLELAYSSVYPKAIVISVSRFWSTNNTWIYKRTGPNGTEYKAKFIKYSGFAFPSSHLISVIYKNIYFGGNLSFHHLTQAHFHSSDMLGFRLAASMASQPFLVTNLVYLHHIEKPRDLREYRELLACCGIVKKANPKIATPLRRFKAAERRLRQYPGMLSVEHSER